MAVHARRTRPTRINRTAIRDLPPSIRRPSPAVGRFPERNRPLAAVHLPPAPSPARIEEGGRHRPPRSAPLPGRRSSAPPPLVLWPEGARRRGCRGPVPRANGRMEVGMSVDCCGRCSLGMGFFSLSFLIWWI
jgi:hypothetical protein